MQITKKMDQSQSFLFGQIEHGCVTIFTKQDYFEKETKMAMELLDSLNVPFKEVKVTKVKDAVALSMQSGQSHFPHIYVGKEHIGSYDDLKSYTQDQQLLEFTFSVNGINRQNIKTYHHDQAADTTLEWKFSFKN